jgi:DNA excision repair protein ERCC-4
MDNKRPAKSLAAMPVIIVDTREQSPYGFSRIPADASNRGASKEGETFAAAVRVGTLKSGDYSLEGFTDRVAVERKSLADLFGTVGQGRERFVRELTRLSVFDFAAVMVEAEWSQVISDPPQHSQLSPKTIVRSVLAWQQRFPRVHWHFWPDRASAEIVTYRILERWWKEYTTAKPIEG